MVCMSSQEEAAVAMKNVLNAVKLQDRGVYVQASTLGSLEALLEFLKTSKIPVSTFLSCFGILLLIFYSVTNSVRNIMW